MRVAVVADTHLRSGDLGAIPEPARVAMAGADLTLHAGDVVAPAALAAMRELCEVRAVLGNNDDALAGVLPETLLVELAGVRVAVVHDAGRTEGRAGRLRRRFPTADLVVFGHSHVPCDALGLDGQVLFNPGSATQRRSQPRRTFGLVDLEGGTILRRRIVVL